MQNLRQTNPKYIEIHAKVKSPTEVYSQMENEYITLRFVT